MENYCSVTGELREWAKKLTHWWYDPVKDEYTYTTGTMPPSTDAVRLDERLVAIADRIDAAHERAVMSAMNDALYQANEERMAELGWVRKNKEHVISHATVEVTPHIDWSRMADELDEFVEIVRGMAGDAE